MYYVYVLKLSNRQNYVGYTDAINRRLLEHKKGKVRSTKKYLPFRLIFYEAFASKEDARRRERYLKTSKGKSTLKMMLRYSIEK